jgi:hypothetical protein
LVGVCVSEKGRERKREREREREIGKNIIKHLKLIREKELEEKYRIEF